MESFVFKDPLVLILIPLALIVIYVVKRRQKEASFRFSYLNLMQGLKATWRIKGHYLLFFIRLLAIVLLVVALSGPRKVLEETIVKSEGIDIALAIDASGSMAAEDFELNRKRVNRLDVTKQVVDDFISQRTADQIGLIAFAGLAYTVCPLTTDYSWLKENLERVELGLIEDGTAIGSAIASAIARLRLSKAESKIIILLTDGIHNAGEIDPLTAAKTAKSFGIKIYTIGVGTKGFVPYPARDFFGRKVYRNVVIELDEATLKEVADITGGKYFYAKDTQALQEVYEEIDALEKTEIEEIGYFEYVELFPWVLGLVLLLLLIEVGLKQTVFLKLP